MLLDFLEEVKADLEGLSKADEHELVSLLLDLGKDVQGYFKVEAWDFTKRYMKLDKVFEKRDRVTLRLLKLDEKLDKLSHATHKNKYQVFHDQIYNFLNELNLDKPQEEPVVVSDGDSSDHSLPRCVVPPHGPMVTQMLENISEQVSELEKRAAKLFRYKKRDSIMGALRSFKAKQQKFIRHTIDPTDQIQAKNLLDAVGIFVKNKVHKAEDLVRGSVNIDLLRPPSKIGTYAIHGNEEALIIDLAPPETEEERQERKKQETKEADMLRKMIAERRNQLETDLAATQKYTENERRDLGEFKPKDTDLDNEASLEDDRQASLTKSNATNKKKHSASARRKRQQKRQKNLDNLDLNQLKREAAIIGVVPAVLKHSDKGFRYTKGAKCTLPQLPEKICFNFAHEDPNGFYRLKPIVQIMGFAYVRLTGRSFLNEPQGNYPKTSPFYVADLKHPDPDETSCHHDAARFLCSLVDLLVKHGPSGKPLELNTKDLLHAKRESSHSETSFARYKELYCFSTIQANHLTDIISVKHATMVELGFRIYSGSFLLTGLSKSAKSGATWIPELTFMPTVDNHKVRYAVADFNPAVSGDQPAVFLEELNKHAYLVDNIKTKVTEEAKHYACKGLAKGIVYGTQTAQAYQLDKKMSRSGQENPLNPKP